MLRIGRARFPIGQSKLEHWIDCPAKSFTALGPGISRRTLIPTPRAHAVQSGQIVNGDHDFPDQFIGRMCRNQIVLNVDRQSGDLRANRSNGKSGKNIVKKLMLEPATHIIGDDSDPGVRYLGPDIFDPSRKGAKIFF